MTARKSNGATPKAAAKGKRSRLGAQRPDFADAVAQSFDKARRAAVAEHIRHGRLPLDHDIDKPQRLKRAG